MLGRTAGGVFWMLRYMERSENTARMIDAGLRISLTRSGAADGEWTSILTALGLINEYNEAHDSVDAARVINFLLRDKSNSGSVMSCVENARTNARMVRTALTREVWEAVNECWMDLNERLARQINQQDLPEILSTIRKHGAFVRGTLAGTMVRNDIYNLARVGSFFERSDNVARVMDVKYYILLPSILHVGTTTDNVQWEALLRATSATRAYQTLHENEFNARDIARFLILDQRLPRSLAFCCKKIKANLEYLADDYGKVMPSNGMINAIALKFETSTIDTIFDYGLHEFITEFLIETQALGRQIEIDYRFSE